MKAFLYFFLSILLTSCNLKEKQLDENKSNCLKIDFPEHISTVFYLDDDYLLYQAYKGDIVKWNIENEVEEWRCPNLSKRPATTYLVKEKFLYFNEWGGSPIMALDFNGKKELEIEESVFSYSNKIIGDADGVLVFGVNGLSKVNLHKKRIDWIINCFNTSTKCNLSSADAGNNVIVGGLGDNLSFDYNNILSINKVNGEVNWSHQFKGDVSSEIAVGNKNVSVGVKIPSSEKISFNNMNYLISLDRLTGKLIWKKQYEFTLGTEILFKEDKLILKNQDKLFSVNADKGFLIWSEKFSHFFHIVGAFKKNIVLKHTRGIYFINPNNGKIIRKIDAIIESGPWIFDNAFCYYSQGSLFISKL